MRYENNKIRNKFQSGWNLQVVPYLLKIEKKKVTILVNEVSENLLLGSRNIKNICVMPATSASAYDLLDNQLILIDLASIELLNKQLAN